MKGLWFGIVFIFKMEFRREYWMKSLGMNFDGSYKARSLEIHRFYENQKLVIGEYDHPLSQSPKVHLHSEFLVD